jgi:uncharacterized protein (TIGR02147 family)
MKPNIFKFTDYRAFIQAYYESQKEQNPHFSFQVFCTNAGLPNKGLVHNVIHGVKNLSRASALKFSLGMRLTKSEADYFENLVFFNQAKNVKEKNHYYEKLQSVRPMTPEASIAKKVADNQFEFYSTWYGSAIRSIIDMFPGKGDYKWIAKNLYPRLSPVVVRKAIQNMLKLGLLKKKGKRLSVQDKFITTGPEARSLAVAQFHLQMMQRAAEALKELPSDKRHITGLTLGISNRAYGKIRDEILAVQEKIMKIARNDEDSDSVYQLNFHFFPLSKTPIKKD